MSEARSRLMLVAEAVVGGVKRHVLDICERLDRERFEITAVLAPGRDPSPEDTARLLADLGIELIPLNMRRSASPWMLLGCARRLQALITERRPHVIHAHSSVAGFIARVARARAGVGAVVYTPHGLPFTMQGSGLSRWAFLQTERYLARYTDRLVAVCESECETAIRTGVIPAERCVVIENGVARPPSVPVDRAAVLGSLGVREQARVVLCVGDLRPQKGHVILVKALPRIAARISDVHVLIAGEGEERRKLAALAADLGVGDHLHLLGRRDDVPTLLATCDVFCQPSLWEGCPYALIEAVLAGRPVVASRIPGVVDVVEDGRDAWLVPPEDPGALGEAMIDALQHPQERAGRAAKAREDAEGRFLLPGMIADLTALYEELAER